MTDEPTNLVLEQLRLIRKDQADMRDDLSDIRLRMGAVESHLAVQQMEFVQINRRLDRNDERLARIERRLDLVEA